MVQAVHCPNGGVIMPRPRRCLLAHVPPSVVCRAPLSTSAVHTLAILPQLPASSALPNTAVMVEV